MLLGSIWKSATPLCMDYTGSCYVPSSLKKIDGVINKNLYLPNMRKEV